MAQQPNICKTEYVWHLPGKDLLTEAQHSMLYRVLVPICSSNVGGEIVPSWCRNYDPVTCLQDGHQGNTSSQGCRSCNPPERAQSHTCFSNTKNFNGCGCFSFCFQYCWKVIFSRTEQYLTLWTSFCQFPTWLIHVWRNVRLHNSYTLGRCIRKYYSIILYLAKSNIRLFNGMQYA